jgi:hypothetical protein
VVVLTTLINMHSNGLMDGHPKQPLVEGKLEVESSNKNKWRDILFFCSSGK